MGVTVGVTQGHDVPDRIAGHRESEGAYIPFRWTYGRQDTLAEI